MSEPFRVSTSAIENLEIDASLEVIDVDARLDANDTVRAAEAMRKAGCAAWWCSAATARTARSRASGRDAPLVPLSTGTNNVFPRSRRADHGGRGRGARRGGAWSRSPRSRGASKCVRVAIDGEPDDLALVDAAFLVDDHVGNLMPFEPREAARARARARGAGGHRHVADRRSLAARSARPTRAGSS